MFWSGETLIERSTSLVDPFDPKRVDCAAYTLTVGSEVYVSPSDETTDSKAVTIRQLAQGGAFTIPPGQFAFLITEETVSVPSDALAFISIRAKTKFRGLVNVSGFHVDPGFHGQLTFAVFNAGPLTVHLKQGQPIFLIWYASLDRKSTLKKDDPVKRGLDIGLINSISGEVQSFASLSNRIENVENDLNNRVHSVENDLTRLQTTAETLRRIAVGVLVGVLLGVLLGVVVPWLNSILSKSVQVSAPHRPPAASSTEQPGEFRPDQGPEAMGKNAPGPGTADGDASPPKPD